MIDSSQNIGLATGTPPLSPFSPPVVLRPLTLGDALAVFLLLLLLLLGSLPFLLTSVPRVQTSIPIFYSLFNDSRHQKRPGQVLLRPGPDRWPPDGPPSAD